MARRYICVHGHFYQPPRENPWLETVEVQDSAYPYHDWNERVTAESYAPNAAARIVDGEGWISGIVNNYARISFNFGPTLLSWMETQAPATYRAVLAADQQSQERFGGHGSAIAQAYNHMIMPLANDRDKQTQVLWGIRDFESRFGRFPEGMWLPETAADVASLEAMARAGIRFTILSPYQAVRVRRRGEKEWVTVQGGRVDPTQPYVVPLPSGRSIAVFFYDGPAARAVAFEGLLANGETFAKRLIERFSDAIEEPQLVHIATDGETYGHHHRHGEMALAYALNHVEQNRLADITNYGQFLERFPPAWEAEIGEGTSWSCIHGVERWRDDCGCSTGGHPEWHQRWRAPLREALDWLRDEAAPLYEAAGRELFQDPWEARDGYVEVVLNRSRENVEDFLRRYARLGLSEGEKVRALRLLEMQRHAMLMFTSCGWFFEEVSGIETLQVLQYAGRVVQLARDAFGVDLEPELLARLAKAESNLAVHGNAARLYEQNVLAAAVDLPKVAAHYAVSSLFDQANGTARVHCYSVESADRQVRQVGDARLAIGNARVVSDLTLESAHLSFAAVHFGGQNISGGVRAYRGPEAYAEMANEVVAAFEQSDLPLVLRLLDREFEELTYSIGSLFRDEQRRVLDQILHSALEDAQTAYRQVFERHAPLAKFLARLGARTPRAFQSAAEVVLNEDLDEALAFPTPDPEPVRTLLAAAITWGVALDAGRLARTLEVSLATAAGWLREAPAEPGALEALASRVALARLLPFEVDLWQVQNVYFEVLLSLRSRLWLRTELPEGMDQAWLTRFAKLGEDLGIRVPEMKELQTVPSFTEVARDLVGRPRIPRATYRLQFNPGFTFRDARALVEYLEELGISDAYASPIFKSLPGSGHGYDVTDHSQLNPELGGRAEFDPFAQALKSRGMGLILDIVPNHMRITHVANALWQDVIENGPASIFANFFDVEWHPVKPELENKVLLPILEDQYGSVLESGKLQLTYDEHGFAVAYYDIRLPLDPATYGDVMGLRMENLAQDLGDEHEHVLELRSILTALSYLPRISETNHERVVERNREKEVIKRRIAALYEASPPVRGLVEEALRTLNGAVGDPASFDRLDELLNKQAFRPAYWRVAAEEINYRRFFDINQLAAIKVEEPPVLEHTHQLVFGLLGEGKVTGLRVDHPDGLWDPTEYFLNLQQRYALQKMQARLPVDGAQAKLAESVAGWLGRESSESGKQRPPWPLYVLAEKILGESEQLGENWAVYGTTGYDFMNSVAGLFVDERNGTTFERIYSQFIQRDTNYANLVNSSKKMIMLVALASEINALSHMIERLSERNRRYRDFTRNSLTFAIREVIAGLPVYRTYVTGRDGNPSERDVASIQAAVDEAKRRNPRTAETIFDFLRDTLLLRNLHQFSEADRPGVVNFVMKFQQVTGPVTAKGVEDTSFYIYNRLTSLNEVGGNPQRFGVTPGAFHRANQRRLARWPHAMLATSTHDTKRSEDVRARISVLSELPNEWRAALPRWSELNAPKKGHADGRPAPGRNDEYLLYQTLLGAWPDAEPGEPGYAEFRERIAEYMLKAVKEAKAHTSWVNPNEAYDGAVDAFVRRLLVDDPADPFLADFGVLRRRVAYFGRLNSLSQLVLKLASPGVPDVYRGTEVWDYSLVDPDNRRPVDYERLRRALADLREATKLAGDDLLPLAGDLLERSADGMVKMFVLYRALALRRDRAGLFEEGTYRPLRAAGPKQANVCAFGRAREGQEVIAVAPRLVVGLLGGKERLPLGDEVWGDTWLQLPEDGAGARYRNLFTGEMLTTEEYVRGPALRLASVLRAFPVALLERLP